MGKRRKGKEVEGRGRGITLRNANNPREGEGTEQGAQRQHEPSFFQPLYPRETFGCPHPNPKGG